MGSVMRTVVSPGKAGMAGDEDRGDDAIGSTAAQLLWHRTQRCDASSMDNVGAPPTAVAALGCQRGKGA